MSPLIETGEANSTRPAIALNNVCSFIRGVGFQKHEVRSSSSTGHLPILRAGNIQGKLDTVNDLVWVPKERVSAEQQMRPGDIAICLSSGSPLVVGKTAQLLEPFDGSVGAFCGIIRPHDLASASYLGYWFRSADYLRWRNSQARGANIQNLRFSNLELLTIPWPSLPEQKRIVAILAEQMVAVEKAWAANAVQVDAAQTLLGAELRAIFSNPTWPSKPLCEISTLSSGGTPSRGNPEFFHGTIPWVKTLDLNCSLVTSTEEKISDDAFRAIRGELLPPGTVMVAMYGGSGTIGKSGILGIPATTNQAICSISPNPGMLCSEYLHAWLIWFRPQWMKSSGGNRKDPNINKGIVERMLVPVPPLLEQKRISQHLAARTEARNLLVDALRHQTQSLETLPASILRRAFVGEL